MKTKGQGSAQQTEWMKKRKRLWHTACYAFMSNWNRKGGRAGGVVGGGGRGYKKAWNHVPAVYSSSGSTHFIVSLVEVLTFNRKQAAVLIEACPPADVHKVIKNHCHLSKRAY